MITFGTENGWESGYEIGGTIGGEVTWNVGIPAVVKGSGKTKLEISGKYVKKDVYKRIDSESDTNVKRVSHELIYLGIGLANYEIDGQ
jgi:hypothetical protein